MMRVHVFQHFATIILIISVLMSEGNDEISLFVNFTVILIIIIFRYNLMSFFSMDSFYPQTKWKTKIWQNLIKGPIKIYFNKH